MRAQIRRQYLPLPTYSLKQAFWRTHVGGLLLIAFAIEVLARMQMLNFNKHILLIKTGLFLYAVITSIHVWRRASLYTRSVYTYYARTFSFVIAWIFAYDIIMMLYKIKIQETIFRVF